MVSKINNNGSQVSASLSELNNYEKLLNKSKINDDPLMKFSNILNLLMGLLIIIKRIFQNNKPTVNAM